MALNDEATTSQTKDALYCFRVSVDVSYHKSPAIGVTGGVGDEMVPSSVWFHSSGLSSHCATSQPKSRLHAQFACAWKTCRRSSSEIIKLIAVLIGVHVVPFHSLSVRVEVL